MMLRAVGLFLRPKNEVILKNSGKGHWTSLSVENSKDKFLEVENVGENKHVMQITKSIKKQK